MLRRQGSVATFGVVLLTLSSWACLAFAQAPSQPWTNTRLLPDVHFQQSRSEMSSLLGSAKILGQLWYSQLGVGSEHQTVPNNDDLHAGPFGAQLVRARASFNKKASVVAGFKDGAC